MRLTADKGVVLRQHAVGLGDRGDVLRFKAVAVPVLAQLLFQPADGLDPHVLHPYMWAVKPHYYSTTFYNYPYMFGLLFGLGLYAAYQDDPDHFKAGYDDLFSSTSLGNAAELAARFGIDTRSPAFWRGSLDVVRGDIARFEGLVAQEEVR